MRTLIRPKAWLDVEEAMGYLKEQAGERVAIRFYECVRKTLKQLSRQPGIGVSRNDLKPAGIRSWRVARPFGKWLVFYQTEEDGLEIIRIKHSAMELPSLFEIE